MRLRALALTIGVLCPLIAGAADATITRRDGFLMIWAGIKRPAMESRGDLYTDMPADAPGALEINYAKRRQILEDTAAFRPDEPLMLKDALLWMFRTRNVADPDQITEDTILTYLEKYPLGQFVVKDPADPTKTKVVEKALTEVDLTDLLQKFEALMKAEVHEVSNYSEKFQGKGTAFGESFDMYAMTAAHKTLPYNTLVRVTNVANQKSVLVRINDRGPYVEGRDMDLSLGAFTTIADRSLGKIHATFERLGDVTLVGACGRQDAYQRRLYRRNVLVQGVPETLATGKTMTLTADIPFVVLTEHYPNGEETFVQNWILKGESYTFTPSVEGDYRFLLGTREGQQKWFKMTVAKCS